MFDFKEVNSVKVDLFADLADICRHRLAELDYEGVPSIDDETAVAGWLNVSRIRPSARHWDIKESKEIRIRRRSLPPAIRRGLALVTKTARTGGDLRPWLSRRLKKPSARDALLFDWGITHLHLGENKRDNGEIQGTKELLFALFDEVAGAMYQIVVLDHGSFSRRDLLHIVERNWPELLERHSWSNSNASGSTSDDDIHAWRKLGVTPLVTTDSGRSYFAPGGGIASDGSSVQVTRALMGFRCRLKDVENAIEADRPQIEDAVGQDLPWSKLQARLIEFGPKIKVVEVLSGSILVDCDLDCN